MDIKDLSFESSGLPSVLMVSPRSWDHASIQGLKTAIEHLRGVGEIELDWAWLEHLKQMMAGGGKLLCAFCAAIFLVIGLMLYYALNQLFLRQQTYMELLLILGARRHYIKRPLFYFACMVVTLATCLAFFWTSLIIDWVQPHINQVFSVLRGFKSHGLFIPFDLLLQGVALGYVMILIICHIVLKAFLNLSESSTT